MSLIKLSLAGNNLITSGQRDILWDMTNSIPYLVPNKFQESIFLPINRPKILALGRQESIAFTRHNQEIFAMVTTGATIPLRGI
jgi:hypothetical protein